MTKKAYYAVFKGHTSNIIVNTWDECKNLVNGFKGAIYKKHMSEDDAKEYLSSLKNLGLKVISLFSIKPY